MRSTVMLSIVSGSLIEILVRSVVSSFGAELKRFLTPRLLDFRSSLDRIVHLPVPSENVSRRSKRFRNLSGPLPRSESQTWPQVPDA